MKNQILLLQDSVKPITAFIPCKSPGSKYDQVQEHISALLRILMKVLRRFTSSTVGHARTSHVMILPPPPVDVT